jgi:hypothetical protein
MQNPKTKARIKIFKENENENEKKNVYGAMHSTNMPVLLLQIFIF